MDTKRTISSYLKQIGLFVKENWDESVLKLNNELYLCAALYVLGTLGNVMDDAARYAIITTISEQAEGFGVNGIKSLILNQATGKNPFLQLRNCLFDHFHRINSEELFKRICKPGTLKELMSFNRFALAPSGADEVKMKFLLDTVIWANANIDNIIKHTVDTIIKLEYITVCLSKCLSFKNCANVSEVMLTNSINMLLIIAGTCAREILEYKGPKEVLLVELKKERVLSVRDVRDEKNKKLNRNTSVLVELERLKEMRNALAHYADEKGKEIRKFVKELPFENLLPFFESALHDIRKSEAKEKEKESIKLFGNLAITELPLSIITTFTASTIVDSSSMEAPTTKAEIIIPSSSESSITISQKQVDEKSKLQQGVSDLSEQQKILKEEKQLASLETMVVREESQKKTSELQKETLS